MEDSLKKRYLFKLSTNFVAALVSLVIQAIIPRALGPKAYGDFNFLTSFFNQVASFLDMGASIGFYTKLSQRPQEKSLVTFFSYFFVTVFVITLLFVTGTVATSMYPVIWPGQSIFFIYLAALWGVSTWLIQIFQKMADAYGLTVYTELVNIFQRVVGVLLIVILFLLGWLNLTNLFYYHYFIMGIIVIGYTLIMQRGDHNLELSRMLDVKQIILYVKEFYHYCHPLFIYALLSFICAIFDRWLLQTYAGSIEQGFYGLSYQIGAGCFIFTSAMTPLLTREFAIAYGKDDLPKMAYLFRRYIPIFYSIAAYFSCFIAVQADKVIHIMGGKNFSGALMAVSIMAFYPIYQTYGQLSGSVFYATGQTTLYRNIGIIFILGGLPLTYFLIAPGNHLGLHAGATGLAIKMIIIQVVGVNVQLYFNAKFLGLRFWRYVGHQFASAGCLLLLALASRFSVESLSLVHQGSIFNFLLAGVLYSLMVAILVYSQPLFFGITRDDIHDILGFMGDQLRRC
jgi:O-antigen/teichoic acid export membrane protein